MGGFVHYPFLSFVEGLAVSLATPLRASWPAAKGNPLIAHYDSMLSIHVETWALNGVLAANTAILVMRFMPFWSCEDRSILSTIALR
ncbi:hypothetical protein [Slackia isoflavoniconvertens]|uniref:hypothetical protein n=1 Tax=Slackia isoflavoniconvertens TaxID=572010 RepID=UPI003077B3B2